VTNLFDTRSPRTAAEPVRLRRSCSTHGVVTVLRMTRIPLELIPLPAYTRDLNGLITGLNQKAADTWGRSPALNDPKERYCGSFKLLAADGSRVPADRCWMALALGEKRSFNKREIIVERPDGSRRVALAFVSPLFDTDGVMVGAANVLVDVTDRKRAEGQLAASEVRYRRLFQTAKDGIRVLEGSSGKIIEANAFMWGLLGQEPEQLLGKELHEIGLFEDSAANKEVFLDLQRKGYLRYDNLPVQEPTLPTGP